MTREEQLDRFAKDLEALMNRYAKEFDLTGVDVVGVLYCTATRISLNIIPNPPWKQPPQNGN